MLNPGEDNIGFINDLDGGINFLPRWTNRTGDIWIQKIDALEFKKKHTEEILSESNSVDPEMKKKLKAFLNNLEIDDNPILIVVRLKK